MTTETTDPWEQAVFEAAYQVVDALLARERDPVNTSLRTDRIEKARERLRLHVQLALAKAREAALTEAENRITNMVLDCGCHTALGNWAEDEADKIAALEALLAQGDTRLQEE